MLEITAPFNNESLERLALRIGKHEWQWGDGPAPIQESPWLDEEANRKIQETLLPSHVAREITSEIQRSAVGPSGAPKKPFYYPLAWALGNSYESRLGAFEALVGPIVEAAEADPYVASWRRKRAFLFACEDPELDWVACALAGFSALGEGSVKEDVYAKRAWAERDQPRVWVESVTGRFYSRGGTPWHQISANERARIVKRKQGWELWESDFVSAEPALALTLFKHSSQETSTTNPEGCAEEVDNVKKGADRSGDAYYAFGKEFGIDKNFLLEATNPAKGGHGQARGKLKRIVMGALYGAADHTMEGLGLDKAAIKRVHAVRDEVRSTIDGEFGDRTWGGKQLSDGFELSHWIQGSVADIAFEAFHHWALQGKGLKPIVPIHDGALWMVPFSERIVDEDHLMPRSFVSTSFNGAMKHKGAVRWEKGNK